MVQCNKPAWLNTLSQKRHAFHFYDITVRFHPILLIFGRNIPQEFWNKHLYTPRSYLVYMFVLYLVKTSDASERTLRRRPLPFRLVFEPESRNFFKSLFILLTFQPLSRINFLPPKTLNLYTFFYQNATYIFRRIYEYEYTRRCGPKCCVPRTSVAVDVRVWR